MKAVFLLFYCIFLPLVHSMELNCFCSTQKPEEETNPFPEQCGRSSVAVKANKATNYTTVDGPANPGSFPWVVGLWKKKHRFLSKQPYSFFCGGTLLKVDEANETDMILTSASCIVNNGVSKLWKKFVTNPSYKPDYGGYYGEAKFIVVAGDNDRSDGRDDGTVTVAMRKFCVHESYDFNQQRGIPYLHDIAVVQLAKPIKFTESIQPIRLPISGYVEGGGSQGFAAGWGNGSTLNQVVLTKLLNETCTDAFNGFDEEWIHCAETWLNATWPGDPGGGYFFKGRKGYRVSGVASFCHDCEKSRIVYLTEVSEYVKWIKNTIKELRIIKM